jgi:hypothetical protein
LPKAHFTTPIFDRFIAESPAMQISRIAKIAVALTLVVIAAAALCQWFPGNASMVMAASDRESPKLSPRLPSDISVPSLIGNRKEYDVFSWASFIALNWPVGDNGKVDPNKTIGETGDNVTVWGTWMEDFQVLVKDGESPPKWGSPRQIPMSCQNIGGDDPPDRIIYHASKTEGVVALFNQAQSGPLIDLNSVYVRYEILMNQPMYDYILGNDLYNLTGLAAFDTIDFPAGSLASDTIGAIMVKAAWKTLGDGDDPARFHTSNAYVYDAKHKTCDVMQLGLAGFHISTKTASAPQWIWSTFEHVDNVPDAGAINPQQHYSFFNPECDQTGTPAQCKPNTVPMTPWDPSRTGQIPTQVIRTTPVDPETASINAEFQSALGAVNPKSVWANYMLVATQYPQRPSDPVDPTGRPFPMYLANTVLETFMQGDIPRVSSSCVGCHNRATAGDEAKQSDFTYILSRVIAKN